MNSNIDTGPLGWRFWRAMFLVGFVTVAARTSATEAPFHLVYQGRIIKPDNMPLETNPVDFDVGIYSADGTCLLYQETHSVNMTGSGGSFALPLGLGTPIGPGYTLRQVFSNGASFTGGGSCSYTPVTGDARIIKVNFNDGSGAVALQNQTIRSVPYALYASKLEGLGKSDFLQINTSTSDLSQANANNLFQNAIYTELMALAGGTSTQFAKASDLPVSSGVLNLSGAGKGVRVLDTPAAGDYAVNKNYTDANVGGHAIDATNLAGLSNGESIKWDTTANSGLGGWVRFTPASASGYVTNGGQAGAVSLGPSDANDLSLLTNGTARVTVKSSGNVGIGTTNPGALLQVGTSNSLQVSSLGTVGIRTAADTSNTDMALTIGSQSGADYIHFSGNSQPDNNKGLKFNYGAGNVVANVTFKNSDGFLDIGTTGAMSTNGNIILSPFGKVGIGTTNPGALLDVGIAGTTLGTMRLEGNTSGYVQIQPSAAAGSWTMTLPTSAGSNNQVLTTNGSGVLSWTTPGGSSQWTTSGSNIYYNSGKVGIGTSAPSTNLQVSTSGFGLIPVLDLANSNTGGNGTLLTFSVNGVTQSSVGGYDGYLGLNTNVAGAPIVFSPNTTERMRLLATGNLGIGTPTPTRLLHVSKSQDADTVIKLENTNSGTLATASLELASNAGSLFIGMNSNTFSGNPSVASIWNAANSALLFGTNDVERMRLDNSGKLGIGNTNPGSLLDLGLAGTTLGTMRLEGNTSGYVQIQPSAAAGSWTMTLPSSAGSNNQVLTTNGSGVLSWTTPSGSSQWTTSGSNIYYNTGSVGLGTSTPEATSQLTLKNSSASGYTESTWVNDVGRILYVGFGGSTAANDTNRAYVDSYGYDLALKTKGTSSPSVLIKGSNGRVGIGTPTNTVSHLLQVGPGDGSANLTEPLVMIANTGNSGLAVRNSTSSVESFFIVNGGSGEIGMLSNHPLNVSTNNTTRMTITNTGEVGIGTNPSEKLHVLGNLRVQGSTDCTLGNGSGGTNCTSDIRLKENVTGIEDSLAKILALRGVEFDWNEKSQSPGRHDIGVIAQEVEQVFPTAVIEDSHTGYKKVDYAVLVAPIIQAVKEIHHQFQQLIEEFSQQKEELASKANQQEMDELKKELAELKSIVKQNSQEISRLKDELVQAKK